MEPSRNVRIGTGVSNGQDVTMSNYLYCKSGCTASGIGVILAVAVGLVAVLMAHAPRPCSAAPAAPVSVEASSPHADVAVGAERGRALSVGVYSPSQSSCSGSSIPSAPLRSFRPGEHEGPTAPVAVQARGHATGLCTTAPVAPPDRASRPPPRFQLRGIVLQI
mgnify:FL=1